MGSKILERGLKYQNQEVEIPSKRTIFGKTVAEVRILATEQITDVPFADLEEGSQTISPHEITFKAIAAKIRNEVFMQKMLAPIESNIIPLPHQILALEKVMAGHFMRFLMADEVGMGKTIETGLVLKELKLRGVVKRTLVIVSKTAMLQWKQEMKKHFNETFHIYDTDYINTLTRTFSRLEADNDINIWTQHNQLIVSMDALKPLERRQGWSKQKVEEYNKYRIQSVLEADFDLLVIDECHRVGGSTQLVGRYQMADILCNAIPNVLLLSATPHRGKSDHFRRILQLLDADAFSGEGMPKIQELEPYVVRTEKRQAIDYNGNPLFTKRKTKKIEVSYDNVKHTKQKVLYEAVTEYVVNGFNLAQQTKNTSYGFVMLLFQRMMSSSTQAILDAMQRRAERLSSERKDVTKENVIQNIEEYGFEGQMEMDFEQKIFSFVSETQANYDVELSILQGLIKSAKDCLGIETDAKVEFLVDQLTAIKTTEKNPDVKVLIFTEFTSTQFMLKKVLQERGGYICETINGSMDFDQRIDALKNFKENAQILIATDAAGESLNMQFAYIVINYDMPWNPMVVEQRIGRVDRIGQVHEVQAFNILLDNSIDKRVYEIIEIKLSQILTELGIDKTADVLDSTLERDGISKLYLTSLLNPANFEQESLNWLEDIKQKLKEYQSTEGVLPSMASVDIKVDKVDAIKHSPVPKWLESLTKTYLQTKNIPCQSTLYGLKFKLPGYKESIYTFNIKDSVNNPIPEPLSLQHEIVQNMLSEAIPFTDSQIIPIVKVKNCKSANGFWSIWHLDVKSQFEAHHVIQPIFISDEGDSFPVFAQDIWSRLVQEEELFECTGALSIKESKNKLVSISGKVEGLLLTKYSEIETKISTNISRIRENKEKAFNFREKQMQKIGIENIRQSRLNRLFKEKELWDINFKVSTQAVPNLKPLVVVRITNV